MTPIFFDWLLMSLLPWVQITWNFRDPLRISEDTVTNVFLRKYTWNIGKMNKIRFFSGTSGEHQNVFLDSYTTPWARSGNMWVSEKKVALGCSGPSESTNLGHKNCHFDHWFLAACKGLSNNVGWFPFSRDGSTRNPAQTRMICVKSGFCPRQSEWN